jgi:hypothetical protein
MSKKAIRADGIRKGKREVMRRLANRIKDMSILFYYDLITRTRITYKDPCQTGVKFSEA